MAYEVLDGSRTLGVFTGGSMIVGSAARTDLVSADRTEELARAQYRCLQRLARLDDDVSVWPTHGAGSFCSAPPGAERTSTIGTERATNTLLRAESEDVFVAQLLDSLGTFPPYFLRLGEINRRGPAAVEGDALLALTATEVARVITSGAQVVDVRPLADFGAAHFPGSVPIPLRPVFATWLGWLVNADKPIGDYQAGPLPGADNIELGALVSQAVDLPNEPLVVMCGHGERAMGAASLLARAGHRNVTVLDVGPQDRADNSGHALEISQ